MNAHQVASFLAKLRRRADNAGSRAGNTGEKIYGLDTRTAKKKAAFLRAFEKTRSITLSARLAGIDRTTHYEWLATDAKYRAAFEIKLHIVRDEITDALTQLAFTGVFRPVIYKGQLRYAPRIRIICQLADGTSAFQDELPKGAEVTSSRPVKTYDGKLLGRYKPSSWAVIKLLTLWFPDEFGPIRRRKRKDSA